MIRPCHDGNLDLYRISCGVGRKKGTSCFVEDIDLHSTQFVNLQDPEQ